MTGSSSPCGACKFLRRKCVRGCVFAPYFCHEQGATHFAAIHKVFGASNVSKLLAHLPASDRSEAAITISYEAQARLQDPIYGCVSHIFALQQQVVNLQAQLAALKQLQAAQGLLNGNNSTQNPSERSSSNYPQDVHSWLQSEYPQMVPPFDPNHLNCSAESSAIYGSNNQGGYNNNHNSMVLQDDQDASFASYEGSSSHHSASMASLEYENKSKWPYQDADDLHSMAFGYTQYSL
ncbi:LOB domain-containing protein 29-like [Chenopodium quinoa]|uniref:LOB domain-containing protein n=1 Tax=Chenopodium quinoa TaxID=63459 RepID=A0A803LFE1_CHEQI|nr:LOB domain-containing protein 29-like [Chenopodium quinoa]